jgi:hypothetical protein
MTAAEPGAAKALLDEDSLGRAGSVSSSDGMNTFIPN